MEQLMIMEEEITEAMEQLMIMEEEMTEAMEEMTVAGVEIEIIYLYIYI
jgi:hypothetical protein